MFEIATRESKRLEILTSDFLTFARPSLPNRSPMRMRDLLSNVAGITKAHAASRSVAITSKLTRDIPVEIDAPQVESALLNLVINAIDATPEGGKIEMRASMTGDVVCIEIENSGSSIPPADCAQIFEPFFTTKPAGTGLGLAIARGAAKAHGGDLWLSDNRDGRVTFSMTLVNSRSMAV